MPRDEALLRIARTLIQRYNLACKKKPHERWELPVDVERAGIVGRRGAWDFMEMRGALPSGAVVSYTFDYVRSDIEGQPFVMNQTPV